MWKERKKTLIYCVWAVLWTTCCKQQWLSLTLTHLGKRCSASWYLCPKLAVMNVGEQLWNSNVNEYQNVKGSEDARRSRFWSVLELKATVDNPNPNSNPNSNPALSLLTFKKGAIIKKINKYNFAGPWGKDDSSSSIMVSFIRTLFPGTVSELGCSSESLSWFWKEFFFSLKAKQT